MKYFLNCAILYIIFQLFIICTVSAVDNNGTCVVAQCKGRNTTRSYLTKKCRCDVNCTKYDDCCIDAPYPKSYAAKSFDCVEVKFGQTGAYMKRTCNPITLRKFSLRRKCISSLNYDQPTANYTLKLPVTASNGITYGNQFCAACDSATNYTTWNLHFSCESHLLELNMSSQSNLNLTKYVFNDTLQKWTYVDGNQSEICISSFVPPKSVNVMLRKCRPNVVKSCPRLTSPYSKKCSNYTSIVKHTNGTYFKNEYCALCNNISSTDLQCRRTNSNSTGMRRRTTSSGGTSTGGSSTTAMSTSPTRTSSATTQRIFPAPSKIINNTTFTTQVREFLQIIVKQNCKDFIESLTLAKLVIETKSYATMKRTRLRESSLISGFPVRICEENEVENEEIPQESGTLKFIVNLGVVISILFTSSHLYDFLFSSSDSTLTKRIFASYAIALIIGNVGFIVSNMTEGLCHLLGPIKYFGFLTSFFWLSALAFVISCKIWCCAQESDILGKNPTESQKFSAYSLMSWIFPTVIIFIMAYIAEKNGDFIIESNVYETCWFSTNDETMLKFFIFPLTITISVNFAFYLFSAYVVWVQRTVVAKLFVEHGIDFRFHTGLIITSNLMWSTALIAMYYEDSFLWVCFACLNATLGLLVYLCSPVKHALSIKITAYLNKRFLSVGENEIRK